MSYTETEWQSILQRLRLADQADVFWLSPDPAIDDELLDFRTSSY